MWVWVGGGCRSWIVKMSDVRSLVIMVVNTCNKEITYLYDIEKDQHWHKQQVPWTSRSVRFMTNVGY